MYISYSLEIIVHCTCTYMHSLHYTDLLEEEVVGQVVENHGAGGVNGVGLGEQLHPLLDGVMLHRNRGGGREDTVCQVRSMLWRCDSHVCC